MKIIQIGVGGWGKNHTRILSQLGVLSAVCDQDPTRAKQFGLTYGVNYYTSLEELLAKETFDGAVVCTPTQTHYGIAYILLRNNKHVFIEKPMTYKSIEGIQLEKIASQNKVTLTCGYIERFNPAVSLVKEYVKSKRYGDLIMLEFHRESRMPLHIKDVGIIYDTSVHDIDTALWLFDDLPEVVFAKSGKIRHVHEDFASIMLGFANNKVAVISSNWITPTRVRKFTAVCEEAIITSDFITQEVRIEKENKTEIPRKEYQEPLNLELKNFIRACEGRHEPLVTPRQAVITTKIAEMAILSSEQGTPIFLKKEVVQ